MLAGLQITKKEFQKKPVIIVGNIKNNSSEHIQTMVFSKDIERELINSGEVTFVASSEERSELRDERSEQQQFSSMETAKRLANETGADFMLKGVISTQNDSFDGQSVKFYQVDLELINLESNEKVWLDSKKLKNLLSNLVTDSSERFILSIILLSAFMLVGCGSMVTSTEQYKLIDNFVNRDNFNDAVKTLQNSKKRLFWR